MTVYIAECKASSYQGEFDLQKKFEGLLQAVLDRGGEIISVTLDERRIKRAYCIEP
jgi:indole-3-glycerol phosphate synthase